MWNSNEKPKILVLMSGSIACYKACGLISQLVKNNFEVKIAASASALKFVGEATLEGLTGGSIYSDLWQRGSAMEHIHLERWADLIIAAPASAHFINRVAHGVGDDLLSTVFLAHEFKKPFLMAPAMNTAMYLNPVTQKSIRILKEIGIQILESASGVLACGETGYGKLLEPDLLFQEIQKALRPSGAGADRKISKDQKRILVTAGGTREPIDDVRFLSNASTGLTGEKIAAQFAELGFDVTLDLARSSTVQPRGGLYGVENFDSFESLSTLLRRQLETDQYDLIVHAAAVGDFSVQKAEGKISSQEDLQLTLKKNPKILNHLKSWSSNKDVKVVAFKLTSQISIDEVKAKVEKIIVESGADWVVQNDIKTLRNRSQHEFQIYGQNKTLHAKGVTELVSQIVKEEFI